MSSPARATRRRAVTALVVTLAGGSSLACQLLFPTVAEPSDSGSAKDGRAPDASGDATGRDGGATGPYDPGLDGGFSIYTLKTPGQYAGATFDGRYVYLSPSTGGSHPLRYDTTQEFLADGSWTTFDTTGIGDAGATQFQGAAFDGHGVYFVGYGAPTTPPSPSIVFMRYDGVDFESPSSWQSFDAVTLSAKAEGYSGATFDGRFLYFPPLWSSYLLRYDTTKTFTDVASWAGFDLSVLGHEAEGYQGALYDGRYVYLVPEVYFTGEASLCNGFLLRYDPTMPFDAASSWTSFDVTRIDSNACGFVGGAFDGRYIYLTSYYDMLGEIARYDTTGGFGDRSSWQTFSTQKLDPSIGGYYGGAFDGRFMYGVPSDDAVGNADGILVRFDTAAAFGDPAAWQSNDLSTLDVAAVGFASAVFDGEYLYLVPSVFSDVVRYRARSPSLLPKLPQFHGSFY